MIYCVGLTGTIASGKSTAASIFANLGADVVCADQISRDITTRNGPTLAKIIDHFGINFLTADNNLDRRKLRQTIIDNHHERQWLENLLHPLIRKEIEEKINQANGAYCIIDIPLLKDKKNYPYLDRVLLISAEKSQQINRLMLRDKCSYAHAEQILSIQKFDKKIADDIIDNSTTKNQLRSRLAELHKYYLQEAGIKVM